MSPYNWDQELVRLSYSSHFQDPKQKQLIGTEVVGASVLFREEFRNISAIFHRVPIALYSLLKSSKLQLKVFQSVLADFQTVLHPPDCIFFCPPV